MMVRKTVAFHGKASLGRELSGLDGFIRSRGMWSVSVAPGYHTPTAALSWVWIVREGWCIRRIRHAPNHLPLCDCRSWSGLPDFPGRCPSAQSVEELLDRVTCSGDVGALHEPRLEVSGVEYPRTCREPRCDDAVCEEPEEEFVFPHGSIVPQRCNRCFRFLACLRHNSDDDT